MTYVRDSTPRSRSPIANYRIYEFHCHVLSAYGTRNYTVTRVAALSKEEAVYMSRQRLLAEGNEIEMVSDVIDKGMDRSFLRGKTRRRSQVLDLRTYDYLIYMRNQ